MQVSLYTSYLASRNLTQRYARTFYFASWFLTPVRRNASYAIYAFCRTADSITDEPHQNPSLALAQLRSLVYDPTAMLHLYPWAPAWYDTIQRFGIPREYFLELIAGVEMDLYKSRYQTFEELYLYCYRVASVVGLMMTHVLGYRGKEALYYAEKLGVAMQLTNILRDIGEDLRRGRIYLPQKELQMYGCSEEDFVAGRETEGFYELMRFQVQRARRFYEEGRKGIPLLIDAAGRSTVRLMANLYEGILDKLESQNYPSLRRRVYVSKPEKVYRTFPEVVKELTYTMREGLPKAGGLYPWIVLGMTLPALFVVPMGAFPDWWWMDSFYLLVWAVAALGILTFSVRWLAAGLGAAVIGGVVEIVGVKTGFPFGEYSYTSTLVPQLGGVPLAIMLAWGALSSIAALQTLHLSRARRAIFSAVWVVGIDIVLEVFATQVKGYWEWRASRIPLQNYLAWGGLAAVLSFLFPPGASAAAGAQRWAWALAFSLMSILWLTVGAKGYWAEILTGSGLVLLAYLIRRGYGR